MPFNTLATSNQKVIESNHGTNLVKWFMIFLKIIQTSHDLQIVIMVNHAFPFFLVSWKHHLPAWFEIVILKYFLFLHVEIEVVHENEIMEDSYEFDIYSLFKERIDEGARIYNIFSCLDMIRHNETVPGIAYMCVCFCFIITWIKMVKCNSWINHCNFRANGSNWSWMFLFWLQKLSIFWLQVLHR